MASTKDQDATLVFRMCTSQLRQLIDREGGVLEAC
jgi:hypothetical protein